MTASELFTAQLPLIKEAADNLDPSLVSVYTGLCQSLKKNGSAERRTFESEFASYYGLNYAGLTPQFRKVYFDRLYGLRGKKIDDSTYAPLLRELYEIPRRKGDKALQCSFVSKLVAIHDESRPLFDKYVRGFFGLREPKLQSLDLRIAGFVANLAIIRASYFAWSEDARFQAVFEHVRSRIPELRTCHFVRVCDFVVKYASKLDGQRERKENTSGE